jgi:hypothetical protein
MATFLPKNQNVQKISAVLSFHKRGKEKTVTFATINTTSLKKTIMPLTQQHFLFYFIVHNTLAFTLWHLNKLPSVHSRKMGFKWSTHYIA